MSVTGFAVCSTEYSLCIFRQLACFRLTIHKYTHLPSPDTVYDIVCRWLHHMLTCHRPTISPAAYAVGSIEYSLCNCRQLACFRLTIHKYTHLTSSDTVYDMVCRWLDHMLTCHRPTMSPAAFAVDRSSILSATLGNLVTFESLFVHMLTCHRSTAVFGV